MDPEFEQIGREVRADRLRDDLASHEEQLSEICEALKQNEKQQKEEHNLHELGVLEIERRRLARETTILSAGIRLLRWKRALAKEVTDLQRSVNPLNLGSLLYVALLRRFRYVELLALRYEEATMYLAVIWWLHGYWQMGQFPLWPCIMFCVLLLLLPAQARAEAALVAASLVRYGTLFKIIAYSPAHDELQRLLFWLSVLALTISILRISFAAKYARK